MFVSKIMSRNIITIGEDASIFNAHEKLSKYRIRHLPVTDKDNCLIGIVTDRDIRSALPITIFKKLDVKDNGKKIDGLKIKDIMTKDPVTITPAYTIQDALLMIDKLKVGALPVVDDEGKLAGIISVRDLLRAFINVLGIGEPGTLLCIIVEEKIGKLKEIVDAITEENISFGSIVVARYWEKNKRAVFPYLLTQNVAQVKRKLTKMGFKLLDPMDWYLD